MTKVNQADLDELSPATSSGNCVFAASRLDPCGEP